jgi:cytochrome c oxidase cbb3-type subunit 1
MTASPRAAEPPLVDRPLVKAFTIASLAWLVWVILAGFTFSLQFIKLYLFPGVALLSPGRVRMTHTNAAAYGFIFNAWMAGLYWAIPRLTGRRTLSRPLGWIGFWLWQAIVTATVVGILLGEAQGVEWGETPVWIDPIVVIAVVLHIANLVPPIFKEKEKPLYVSLWYFTAMFAWVGLTYIMGNWIPQYFLPGAGGAAVAGLFIHDLVGLFVTPVGWGLMYYFVPVIMKKPIWSHALSLVGFWGLAFFYPLSGVHHFLWSPIPMYAQYGAVVSTIAIEIVVTTVIVNFFATLRGSGHWLRDSLPMRWFYTGMILYFVTCFQCAVQVTLTVQQIIHFTDWVVGHAHLVMFGVFGFWIFGVFTELWPKLVGHQWVKPSLNSWHYWLSTLGTVIMFLDLMSAGLVEGTLWRDLAPWEQSLIAATPFWWIRSVSGLMIIIGTFLFLYHMWITALAARRLQSASPETSAAAVVV